MLAKLIIRIILAITFGGLANVLTRNNVPPNSPITLPEYTGLISAFVFAIIGFFTPDLLGVIARLGIARLAEDITARIVAQLPKSPIHLPTSRKTKAEKQSINQLVNPMVFDTSAVIDGRIADIANTGFLFGTIVIIPSILVELRHIADSSDDLKRARGRRGLEVLNQIKKNKYLKLEITKSEPEGKDVDDKILKVAKSLKAKIVTTDYNLNKVATVSGVKILNVNELANSIKTLALPGEEMRVKVIHKGKEKDQGVGYLQDGTMVVIESGSDLVGKTIKVKVARILQTVAGRMVFVKAS